MKAAGKIVAWSAAILVVGAWGFGSCSRASIGDRALSEGGPDPASWGTASAPNWAPQPPVALSDLPTGGDWLAKGIRPEDCDLYLEISPDGLKYIGSYPYCPDPPSAPWFGTISQEDDRWVFTGGVDEFVVYAGTGKRGHLMMSTNGGPLQPLYSMALPAPSPEVTPRPR